MMIKYKKLCRTAQVFFVFFQKI